MSWSLSEVEVVTEANVLSFEFVTYFSYI